MAYKIQYSPETVKQYPQIKKLYAGLGHETNGGAYRVVVYVFDEGEWAFGQHGTCRDDNGQPTTVGYDSGHKVDTGWIFVQVRVSYIDLKFNINPSDPSNWPHYTPRYFMGVRMNQDQAQC